MAGVNQSGGGYARIAASAVVCPRPATMSGVFCSTTTAGTFQVYDAATAVTTTPITGVVTPAAGTWTPIPVGSSVGFYVVVTGTLDATVVFA